jgi:pyrimidine-specific ribonucleoside hydrolase
VATAGLLLAACGSPPTSHPSGSAPVPTGSTVPAAVRPLIVDLDLDPGDLLALGYLAHLPGYDLEAVTLAGTGVAHCPPGDALALALLQELGREVPIACGSDEPIGSGHAFPDDWRAGADQLWGLRLAPATGTEQRSAAQLLIDTLAASHAPVDILQLGPATNLATVLDARPDLLDRIHRVVMYGGAFDVSGGAVGQERGSPEWTIWADPEAAATVVSSGVPMLLVPVDASMELPVPADFARELAADHGAAGADLVFEWLASVPGIMNGGYFTGALAATVLEDPAVVDLNELTVSVGTGTASKLGRTLRDPAGSRIQVALVADPSAFKAVYLAGLRRGGPRAHPFTVTGQLTVTYDGIRCEVAPEPRAPGGYSLRIVGSAEGQWGVALLALHEGHAWQELVDFIATIEQQTANPTFVDIYGSYPPSSEGTLDAVVTVRAGTAGFACVEVAANGSVQSVVLSSPFTVPAGAD